MRTGFIRLALLLGLALAAAGNAPAAPAIPVESFAALPETATPQLSPDGRYVAAKMLLGGKYMLVIYDLDNLGKSKPVIASPDDMQVNWLRWKSDERLLVSLSFPSRRWGIATTETRLFALGPDGKNLKQLVQPKANEGDQIQIADNVVDFLPNDPKHILMQFNPQDPSNPRLYRINVYSDQRGVVTSGKEGIIDWNVDQQGQPRIGVGYSDTDMTRKLFHRTPDAREWELVSEEPIDSGATFSPILFDQENPDLVTVYSDHEGDTMGVYRYRMSEKKFVETLFVNGDVDTDGAILDPRRTQLMGIRYITNESNVKWLDRRYADVLEAVRPRVAARALSVASASWDYSRFIIYGESPDWPGRYYLYEPKTRSLRLFGNRYPALLDKPLSPIRSTTFKARDGLDIPAFVTLPPGMTQTGGKPLPAVVLPHGGPTARDMAEFDTLVQYFASRGYAVLQMNFRGSTGYGQAFMQAGFRQWGQAMQDDVTDGTKWLVAEGIADPTRVCIVGWSYGAYAALMGAAKEPNLYQCAIGIAGVFDLRDFLASRRYYILSRVMTRHIGSYWADRKALEHNSPVNRAAEIQVPVLLVHGTKDRVVPVTQTKSMAGALKSAGKNVRYVELEDSDHSVLQSEQRLQLFKAMDEFLAANLAAK